MASGLPFLRNTNFSSYHSHTLLLTTTFPSANHFSTRFFNLNPPNLHSSFNFQPPFLFCRAATPPPPDSGPSSDRDLVRFSGLDAKLLRLKDTIQIFFAVLFWMSLFFWACVWDDKNSNSPTKGSRFRR